jgi:hypothetical protein
VHCCLFRWVHSRVLILTVWVLCCVLMSCASCGALSEISIRGDDVHCRLLRRVWDSGLLCLSCGGRCLVLLAVRLRSSCLKHWWRQCALPCAQVGLQPCYDSDYLWVSCCVLVSCAFCGALSEIGIGGDDVHCRLLTWVRDRLSCGGRCLLLPVGHRRSSCLKRLWGRCALQCAQAG